MNYNSRLFKIGKKILSPAWNIKRRYVAQKLNLNKRNQNKITAFKNKHNNKRCFIIGNGPSLTISDLEKLSKEMTFASNSIYFLYDKTDWRPTYYFCQDPTVIRKSFSDIKLYVKGIKFIKPTSKKQSLDEKTICYYINNLNFRNNVSPEFSTNTAECVYEGYTVTYSMIQFAVYMGFREIYLLGMDFSYVITNGSIDANSYSDKRMVQAIGGNPNLEYSLSAFNAAKTHCDKQGIKIYNSTRGGMLEVYPRVDLDSVLNQRK